ncbi:hypothetical protein BS17DRAFT_760954 [Gyrodon lividus]|nr:hypothetical protein BS17DRAFT_760954 [Gyrodon lividus]
MSRDSVDEPLLPSSPLDECDDKPSNSQTQSRRKSVFLAVSIMLNIILASVCAALIYTTDPPRGYPPADKAVGWVSKRFTDIWDVSIYNGPPSPALDAAWHALYTRGTMQLPKSEVDSLPNKTVPIPGDEDNYIFTFDIFHQLHCLNNIRQALHPEYYNDAYYAAEDAANLMKIHIEGHEGFDHTGHCIDSLRESLMCSADITPIVWAWDEQRKRTGPRLDVVHVCRDYEKLQEWAEAHLLRSPFDRKVHLEDKRAIV